jgi:hypothetical protein
MLVVIVDTSNEIAGERGSLGRCRMAGYLKKGEYM